jgi:hypothetical protein
VLCGCEACTKAAKSQKRIYVGAHCLSDYITHRGIAPDFRQAPPLSCLHALRQSCLHVPASVMPARPPVSHACMPPRQSCLHAPPSVMPACPSIYHAHMAPVHASNRHLCPRPPAPGS